MLMSSLHGDDHLVAAAFRAGARGYLLKSAAATELNAAVREVMRGGIYVSRAIRFFGEFQNPSNASAVTYELRRRLTPVESRLLDLIGGGRSDEETSLELGLSRQALDALLSRVMAQLALTTREELVAVAKPGSALQASVAASNAR
jgi:DNA-binding NarL/FixJ family response regulator